MNYRATLPLLAFCYANMACANPVVDSKEYKLMLDTSLFTKSTELSDVNSVFTELAPLARQATSKNTTGSVFLAKTRKVTFYDIIHECTLAKLGYVFRERTDQDGSEVTLKYRHTDRYLSAFEDLSADSDEAKTKLEADYSIAASGNWKVTYSHSTKTPNTRNINEVKDINYHFSGFHQKYQLSSSLTLQAVSGLAISEYVYEGIVIDLGKQDAEFALTLWYTAQQSNTPLIAELSFKYQDNQGDYSQKVASRAADLFDKLASEHSAVNALSLTKTQFVYQYQPSFCAEN
ncbi:hypothetical protein [Pseudoalteromonas obscura]|uniref:Orphan protein n=1 Tax=Pseudoalteromonas obscura TaxID=3048491 RepID=A0ABT7EKK6_9GAMM|nr:hypothetical protein [Pseudoalteromonas sp. P94(2023)]MDK2595551.1 hypothetical protein [Pseudoalteromonas sp. P94(2023)]